MIESASDFSKSLLMYIAEAEFFENVLTSDVSKLPIGSHLVEIGAGIGLLALNLAAQGYNVTAFEPEASGFTEMHSMRETIVSKWVGKFPAVNFVDKYIDDTTKPDKLADYMFAINVIEHVPDYRLLIVNALKLKSDSATLRLICPNYAIPYEPHLEIPIILTKNLTWRIFKTRIAKSTIPNPVDFWKDLSWPSQRKLKKLLKEIGVVAESYTSNSGSFVIQTRDVSGISEKARIDSSGNLGIGNTTPSTSLAGSVGIAINSAANGNTQIRLQSTSTGTGSTDGLLISLATNNDAYLYNYENANLIFGTNNTERARFDTSGNLLVGTTSGSARLRVVATASQSGAIYATHVDSAEDVISCENSATSGNNVFIQFYTDATVSRGSITYNRAGGLVVYNTTSDYRAKDISGPVTNSGALIDSVPVYMGKMKWAEQERPMFIAHEVPAYAHTGEKDAVDADGNPVYQQMDASALIPVMWAEIQSLRKRLADAGI